jgi:predicted anti-sigma-YlaC factor YlaD
MSNHVTDDDLILHFYGEANSEAPRIDAHLAECADCCENWNALQQTLKMVDSAEVPEQAAVMIRVARGRFRAVRTEGDEA